MSITYATPDELAAYVDPDAETPAAVPLATVLIRYASRLVIQATQGSVYDTTDAGLPTDPLIYGAMHEATMEQASAWAANKIDPRKGSAGVKLVATTKGLGGASVSYGQSADVQAALVRLASGKSLTEDALRILSNAGLISSRIATAPGYSAGTPTIPGPETVHGGYPDDHYPEAPVAGWNI